ncbi:unnamed protein product, partial [Dovyalis caffra]
AEAEAEAEHQNKLVDMCFPHPIILDDSSEFGNKVIVGVAFTRSYTLRQYHCATRKYTKLVDNAISYLGKMLGPRTQKSQGKNSKIKFKNLEEKRRKRNPSPIYLFRV